MDEDEPRFQDELTRPASDEGEVGSLSDSGVVFYDRAPGSDTGPVKLPEPPPAKAAPAPTPAAPAKEWTGAHGEAALPPRVVAKRPDPQAGSVRVVAPPAVCPACGAANPADCLRCARCAAPISGPAPTPVAPPPPEGAPPEDPADLLPPKVREQVLAARAASQANTSASVRREEQRMLAVCGATAGAAVVAGAVLSMVMIDGLGRGVVAAACDGMLGAGAGWAVWRKSSAVTGALAFGGAAFLSGLVKLGLNGMPQGERMLAVFFPLVFVAWLATMIGGWVGRRIDDWYWE